MKKIFVCLFLVVILAAGKLITLLFAPPSPGGSAQNDIRWERNDEQGVTIAFFKRPLEFHTTWNNPDSLQIQVKKQGYLVAVNGSYFKGSYEHAGHAGLLKLGSKVVSPLATDRQLTHVVTYKRHGNRLVIVSTGKYHGGKTLASGDFAFQTGPLVLRQNEVQQAAIIGSYNGRGRYLRTLLGQTDKGELFFVVTAKPYALADLGNILLHSPGLQSRKIDAINLDGGPSTALCSLSNPEYDFNSDMVLPIVLGVKHE